MNDKVNEAQAYWDSYEEEAKQGLAAGGGGNVIAHVKVETGWKGFATGTSQDDTWFPANRGDKEAWNTAKKAAAAVCDTGRFPSSGVTIIANKEKYYKYGEKQEYEDNRHFFRSEYHELTTKKDADGTPKGHAVLFPALRAAGVIAGFEGWARLTWVRNPYYLAKGDDEKAQNNSICIITETFPNPAAARKAIKEMPKRDAAAASDVPEGYTAADWDELHDTIVEALESQEVSEVAEDYQVEESYIQVIADSVVPV